MDSSANSASADESVVVPLGILSTLNGQHRRSYDCRAQPVTGHGGRRVVSMFTAPRGFPSQQDQAPATSSSDPSETITSADKQEDSSPNDGISDSERPQPAAIDFAQPVAKDGIEGDTEKQNTAWTNGPVQPEDTIEELDAPNRSSVIFKRLSYVARSVVGSRLDRQSGSSDGRSNRYSAFFRRRSYDSHYPKDENAVHKKHKRQSKAIPKSWKFLGIDAPGVDDTVSSVKSNFMDTYEKAKIKQEKIRRSMVAQLIFRYTFYILLLATVYLLLVGLPLWRGLVWYMYIVFQKHLVLKAGLTITFGIGFL